MVVIRNSFIAKPGCASKLAQQMKGAAAAQGLPHRILTDLTGDFNRVVLEFEAESVGAFEALMKERSANPEVREKMAGYTELWITGSREIFQVVS